MSDYQEINEAYHRNIEYNKSLQLGRNDYCHCGKVVKKKSKFLKYETLVRVKYKNCCMSKDKKLK